MKTYIVDSIKYPLEIVYANTKTSALKQYAHKQGFSSVEALEDDCRREFGIITNTIDMIDISCISSSIH